MFCILTRFKIGMVFGVCFHPVSVGFQTLLNSTLKSSDCLVREHHTSIIHQKIYESVLRSASIGVNRAKRL